MDELAILLDRLLPEALEMLLRRVLGDTMPRLGDGDRYRIRAAGRFSGKLLGDLLAQGENQELDGALLLVERDVRRVIYFVGGQVAGSDSNVLFERLGRLLANAGVLEEEAGDRVVEAEERDGSASAASLLPPETAVWALDHRTREVVSALYLMARGHYVFVEGRPQLGSVPELSLSPMGLAMEGMRRYDEWRNRSVKAEAQPSAPRASSDPMPVLDPVDGAAR